MNDKKKFKNVIKETGKKNSNLHLNKYLIKNIVKYLPSYVILSNCMLISWDINMLFTTTISTLSFLKFEKLKSSSFVTLRFMDNIEPNRIINDFTIIENFHEKDYRNIKFTYNKKQLT